MDWPPQRGLQNSSRAVKTFDMTIEKAGLGQMPPGHLRWIDELVSEGLTMLAGRTKVGTSWFALLLALKVAARQSFLGYPTEGGEVLYLALTDDTRRLQDRALLLGADELSGMDRFHYFTTWPTVDHGALNELEEWIRDHPTTNLIVIDPYMGISDKTASKGRLEETLLGALQQLAIKHRVGLILTHHLCKRATDHWREQLCGSRAGRPPHTPFSAFTGSRDRRTPPSACSPETCPNSISRSGSTGVAGNFGNAFLELGSREHASSRRRNSSGCEDTNRGHRSWLGRAKRVFPNARFPESLVAEVLIAQTSAWVKQA